MIYADELLSFLEEEYQGYYSIDAQQGVDFLKITINKENLAVEIIFDAEKQTIELNTFTGKTAVFNSIVALKTNLTAYFFFELQFKPQSKKILDLVMKKHRPGETYTIKGIEGNATSALKLITSTDIVVMYADNVYKVLDDTGVIEAYTVDEQGNISEVPTMGYYLNKLSTLYANSDTVDILRLSEDTFRFTYASGLCLCVRVIIEDTYKYEVQSNNVNGFLGIIDMEDVFDLERLAAYYAPVKSDTTPVENITEAYDMKDVEITVSDKDKELSSLEINAESDEVPADTCASEVPNVLSLVRILSKEGKLLYIRYVCENEMYDVEASEVSLNILEEEQQIVHKGVLTTPSELSRRKPAKKVTDTAFIDALVNNFYS